MKILKIKNIKRYRLSIYKSNNYIYVQLIDDINSHTIFSISTLKNEIKLLTLSTIKKIFIINKILYIKIKKLHLNNIIIDIKNNKYNGLIKILLKNLKIKL